MERHGGFWSQWWRVGGALGIGFVILFLAGGIGLQGDSPVYDDPIDEIRSYFIDEDTRYLTADYLFGLAFVFFFLPFLMALRGLLSWVEGVPNILSWLAFIGGLSTALLGAAAGVSWGALALGAAADPEVNDSSVRTLMYVDTYAFSALPLTIGLLVLPASVVIYRTGVLWRWLALLGLLVGMLGVIGAAWPIEGDDEGFLAILGFISFIGLMLWILLVSVNMLMKRELPARAAAWDVGVRPQP